MAARRSLETFIQGKDDHRRANGNKAEAARIQSIRLRLLYEKMSELELHEGGPGLKQHPRSNAASRPKPVVRLADVDSAIQSNFRSLQACGGRVGNYLRVFGPTTGSGASWSLKK